MQRDTIAFTVEDNGAQTVRANRVARLEHFAPVGSHRRGRVVQAPLATQVNKQAVVGGLDVIVIGPRDQTTAYSAWFMRQYGKGHSGVLLFVHRSA